MERLARGALLVADPTRLNPVDRWMGFANLAFLASEHAKGGVRPKPGREIRPGEPGGDNEGRGRLQREASGHEIQA
ncbi:MAG: hypothetical protein EXR94_12090 [Gemmatimonadetes bacterium]|nr:hypothetical protein [Gemmatimonadota bacterium]